MRRRGAPRRPLGREPTEPTEPTMWHGMSALGKIRHDNQTIMLWDHVIK